MEQNNQKNNKAPEQDFNEIVKIRREKLANLKESGNDPFLITKFDFNNDSKNIWKWFYVWVILWCYGDAFFTVYYTHSK